MPLILPGNVATATAATTYDVANSCRFNTGDSPSLSKTMVAGSTDFAKKFTISVWIKLASLDGVRPICSFGSGSSDAIDLLLQTNGTLTFESWDGTVNPKLNTNRIFLDNSAWYNIVITVDTTQGTAANRMKMYINGVQETNLGTAVYAAEDYLFPGIGTTNDTMKIGSGGQYSSNYFNGYMAEFVYCDGQALGPTSFGEFDSDSPNIWKPIDVSGLTFGNAGTYCDFEDSGNLGDDESGNTNDLTENNIAAIDQTTDTCTNNFAVWDPLTNRDTANGTWTEGNLRILASGGDVSRYCTLPIPLNFKFYFEVKAPIVGAQAGCGLTTIHDPLGLRCKPGENNGYGWKFRGAASVVQYFNNGTSSNHATNNPSDDSIMGFAVDCANGRMHMSIDGTYLDSSDPTDNDPNSVVTGFSTTVPQYLHTSLDTRGASQPIMEFNFGNPIHSISSGNADANGYGNFEFAVPSGYLAFCTKNMADF